MLRKISNIIIKLANDPLADINPNFNYTVSLPPKALDPITTRCPLSKHEIESALLAYENNKKWFKIRTWSDDEPIKLLREFVQKKLKHIKSTAEIDYQDFLAFLTSRGHANLLNRAYFESKAASRHLFLKWQNSALLNIPTETWHRILSYLSKEQLALVGRTCSHLHTIANDPSLMRKAAPQARDYSQQPKTHCLTSLLDAHAVSPDGYLAFSTWYGIYSAITIIDYRTRKHMISFNTDFTPAVKEMHFMANGNLLVISNEGDMRSFDSKTGDIDTGKQSTAPITSASLPSSADQFLNGQPISIDTKVCHFYDSNANFTLRSIRLLVEGYSQEELSFIKILPNGDFLYGSHVNYGGGNIHCSKLFLAQFPRLYRLQQASTLAIDSAEENTPLNNFRRGM